MAFAPCPIGRCACGEDGGAGYLVSRIETWHTLLARSTGVVPLGGRGDRHRCHLPGETAGSETGRKPCRPEGRDPLERGTRDEGNRLRRAGQQGVEGRSRAGHSGPDRRDRESGVHDDLRDRPAHPEGRRTCRDRGPHPRPRGRRSCDGGRAVVHECDGRRPGDHLVHQQVHAV